MASRLRLLFAFVLCICLFAACSKAEDAPPELAPESQQEEILLEDSSAPEKEIEPVLPVGELDPTPVIESVTGDYSLCIYQPEGIYIIEKIPAARKYSVLELIKLCGESFGIDPLLIGFDIQKGMITLDWESGFIDLLIDEEQEKAFLGSVCMTIQRNLQQAEWFNFKKDGDVFISQNTVLEADQPYEYPPLKLGDDSPEYYTSLRAEVPYPGMISFSEEMPFDDISEEMNLIMELLVRVGAPNVDFDSPEKMTDEFIVGCALNNLPMYSTYYTEYDEFYVEGLLPIGAAVNDTTFTLKEHVEIAANEMFGDVQFNHVSINGWIWHEKEGVYTPPHHGGGAWQVPYIFTSIEGQNGIIIETAYLHYVMDNFVHPETGELIPKEEAADLVPQVARLVLRHDIALRKTANGVWQFYSHKFSRQIMPDREESAAETSNSTN